MNAIVQHVTVGISLLLASHYAGTASILVRCYIVQMWIPVVEKKPCSIEQEMLLLLYFL
jgi:hypothetical protein